MDVQSAAACTQVNNAGVCDGQHICTEPLIASDAEQAGTPAVETAVAANATSAGHCPELTVPRMEVKSILGRCSSFLISSSLQLSAETVLRVRSMLATPALNRCLLSLPILPTALLRRGAMDLLDEPALRVVGPQLQLRLLWKRACMARWEEVVWAAVSLVVCV